jgi:hypothetical protein
LNKKKQTTTYDVGNPDFGLGQAQIFGGVKPVIYMYHTLNIQSIFKN